MLKYEKIICTYLYGQSLYTCILKAIRCTWQPKIVILWSIFYAVTYWNDCVFYCVEFDVWCRLVFVASCVCFLSHLLLMWSIYYWKCFITISTFILQMSVSPFCSASTWRPIKEKLRYWIDHQMVPSLGKTEKLEVPPKSYGFVSGERASGASNTPAESGFRQAKYKGVFFHSVYLSQNKLSVNHWVWLDHIADISFAEEEMFMMGLWVLNAAISWSSVIFVRVFSIVCFCSTKTICTRTF